MKPPICILAICAGAALFAAGCGKTEVPPAPNVAKQAPPAQGPLTTPVPPPPKMADPVVPKGAGAPSPVPGQANDHSSPAFKDGGKTAPQK